MKNYCTAYPLSQAKYNLTESGCIADNTGMILNRKKFQEWGRIGGRTKAARLLKAKLNGERTIATKAAIKKVSPFRIEMDKQKQRVLKKYQSGKSVKDISVALNISIFTIYGWLKNSEIELLKCKRGHRSSKINLEKAMAMSKDGATFQSIGEVFGVSKQAVQKKLSTVMRDDLSGRAVRQFLNVEKIKEKKYSQKNKTERRIFDIWGLTLDVYTALKAKYGSSAISTSPLAKYKCQKSNAATRGIGWELTFAEWWQLWQASGKFDQRGRGHGYVMARFGDSGTYEIGNVEIITAAQNSSDSYLTKPGKERAIKCLATKASKKIGLKDKLICKKKKT